MKHLWAKWQRVPGAWRFFAAAVFLWAVAAAFHAEFAIAALERAGLGLLKLLPILTAVYLVMALVDRFIRPDMIRRHLGRDSGWRGTILVFAAGLFVSGPPLIMFPLLGDLKRDGLSDRLIATFLYLNNVKVVFLPVMAHYFGLEFTVVLTALIIVFSLLVGPLVSRLANTSAASVFHKN